MAGDMNKQFIETLHARAYEERSRFYKIYGRFPDDKEAERIALNLIDEAKLGLAINKTKKKR